MSGCDYGEKRFSVQMHTKKLENIKCWDCLNHKYNGGEGLDGEVCKQCCFLVVVTLRCEGYNNFKEAESGRKANSKAD